jgi:hypothetical protein
MSQIELADLSAHDDRRLLALALIRGMAQEEGIKLHSEKFMGWAKSFAERAGLAEPRVWGDLPIEALERLVEAGTQRQFQKWLELSKPGGEA